MTISALIPPLLLGSHTWVDKDDTLAIIFYWVIPIGALVVGIILNKHYPDYYKNKHAQAHA